MLNLYNTKTKQIDSLAKEKINLYSCGPTVYNYAHIGNLRSFVFTDLLKRILLANGSKVNWVMNITDVDDKTIRQTIEQFGSSATPKELAGLTAPFTKEFLRNLESLNIKTDEINTIAVSESINAIKEFIYQLLDLGFAYKAEDGSGVYFNIEKYQKEFGDYGELVGDKFLEGKKVGARVAVDEYEKDDLSDFALWKAKHNDDGEIFWEDAKLGAGRPGWHIECSAINKLAFAGQATDLHTGGVDLIFPHHTNEIAQSQPIYKPFVTHWAHSEHLQIDNKKMAKRENNFLTLRDLESQTEYAGMALRYFYLQSDFRNQQNFTGEAFDGAVSAVKSLVAKFEAASSGEIQNDIVEEVKKELNNNLNTAKALAILHLTDNATKETLTKIDEILGLGISQSRSINLPENIEKLISERQEARDNKNFARSDELRKEIEKAGYEVMDTDQGQKILPK